MAGRVARQGCGVILVLNFASRIISQGDTAVFMSCHENSHKRNDANYVVGREYSGQNPSPVQRVGVVFARSVSQLPGA